MNSVMNVIGSLIESECGGEVVISLEFTVDDLSVGFVLQAVVDSKS